MSAPCANPAPSWEVRAPSSVPTTFDDVCAGSAPVLSKSLVSYYQTGPASTAVLRTHALSTLNGIGQDGMAAGGTLAVANANTVRPDG